MPRQHLGFSRLRPRLIIITYICPHSVARRRRCACGLAALYAAIGARYVSPRVSTAHAIRAFLLATATVTSLAGLRSSRLRIQAPLPALATYLTYQCHRDRCRCRVRTQDAFYRTQRKRIPDVYHYHQANGLGRRIEIAERIFHRLRP